MNFRILDLFLLTTYVAIMFAVFQVDLILFRQLLFLSFTAAAALAGSFMFPSWKDLVGKCAIVASFGGLAYVCTATLFHDHFYKTVAGLPFPNKGFHFSEHLTELSLGPLIAAAIGAGLGPLIASFALKKREKTDSQPSLNRNQSISCILLAATILLAFFAMLDRYRMAATGRDWNVVLIVVLIGFVVFTAAWGKKLLLEEQSNANAPSSGFQLSGEPDT